MKANLYSYLDYNNASLEDQVLLANSLNLKQLIIRNISGKNIMDLTQDQRDLVADRIHILRLKIVLVDPNLPTYNIHDLTQKTKYLEKLDECIVYSKKINAKIMIYKIPKYTDIMDDLDVILSNVKEHLEIFKKHKIEPLIRFGDNHKSNEYRYILNVIKSQLNIEFDSHYLYHNHEPITTSFRLLKDNLGSVIAIDEDKFEKPRLLGYGVLEIMDTFKRLHKMEFSGNVIYDTRIFDLIKSVKSKKSIFSIFSKEKKKDAMIYHDLLQRVGGDSVYDILSHQLTILNVVLFNKKTSQ